MLNAIGQGLRGLGLRSADGIVGAARNYNTSVADNLIEKLSKTTNTDEGQKLFDSAIKRQIDNLPREAFYFKDGLDGLEKQYQFVDGRNSLDLARIAAQTGYGRGMQGARYAGQIIKENPIPVALGGLGVGTGLYAMGLTPDPFGQRDRNSAYDPMEPAPNGQPYARELSDEEILEMQMMGML